MHILRIGDPHIKPSNLEDAEKLMHFVQDTILKKKPDRVEILGDLLHTHAVIRLEVLEFWNFWLDTLSELVELVVLVGNHDMSGDHNSSSHSLSVFKHIKRKNLKIVEFPRLEGIFGYISYTHDQSKFVEVANSLANAGAKVLVCHQTFNGSQYENGFYAPDGISPDLLNFDLIISGHIHKRQVINAGNKVVNYPGTPKWDSASDANEDKGIWLYEHDDLTGKILSEEFISTYGVCTPILQFTWSEGQESPTIPENARATVELIGSSDWISKQKSTLKGKVSITSKITDKKKLSNRQTGNSLENFLKNVYVTSIDKESLFNYAKEIGLV